MKTYSGITITDDSAWTADELKQMETEFGKRYMQDFDKVLEKKQQYERGWNSEPGKMSEGDLDYLGLSIGEY